MFRVFGSVRKPSDAKAVVAELGNNFVPLILGITDSKAVDAAVAQVEGALRGEKLAGLVNNAGIAVIDAIQALSPFGYVWSKSRHW